MLRNTLSNFFPNYNGNFFETSRNTAFYFSMPPSLGLLPKQNPLVFHEKSKPPLLSGNNSPCDKSTATSSTEDLSCISIASSSHSKHSGQSSSPKMTTTKSSRSLSAPVTLHSQSSLLDMTIDESHDDEISIDHGASTSPHKVKSKRFHDNDNSTNSNEVTADSTMPNTSDFDLGSSIMEQTEKNLAAISESMSGSFCAQGADVNNSCTLPDCSNFSGDASKRKLLFSDTVIQNRLLDDFNFLLGSNDMPCTEEKNICNWIVLNCFGTVDNQSVDNTVEESNKIRNRAGESWRARAYRIRRLREERMMKSEDDFVYSLSNRRQLSMDRTLRKSRSAEGRIDHPAPSKLQKNQQANRQRYPRRPKHEVNSDPLGRMIGDCIDPISPVKEDAVELEIVWKDQETDLCYDSDPGETSYRKSLVSKKKGLHDATTPSRYISRSKSAGVQNEPTQSRFGQSRRRRNPKIHSSLDQEQDEDPYLGGNGSFDIHVSFEEESEYDEDTNDSIEGNPIESPWYASTPTFKNMRKKALKEDTSIAQTVQVRTLTDRILLLLNLLFFVSKNFRIFLLPQKNAMNRTWTLTWHPIDQKDSAEERKTKMTLLKSLSTCSPTIMEVSTKSPRCIRLWFERGNRIRGNNIVEPKLMWRDAYHPELSSHRKLNDSTTNGPQQICLLSICRILEVKDQIDRKMYPFAKKSCSFLIRTCDDDEFLFEAQTEKERDELVYLWKLVVARLASQAVVGDGDKMVGEFFVPSHFGVP